MQRYLDKLRWRLMRRPEFAEDEEQQPHMKWGFYHPRTRFSGDQVALEFDHSGKAPTWAHPTERSTGFIPVRGGVSGWEKRMGTWHMVYSADSEGPQPEAVVILKGKGQISQMEKESYPKDVRVLWSDKGWMTRKVAAQWAQDIWTPWRQEHLAKEPSVLLVLDNLDAQRTRSFEQILRKAKTTLHLGEPSSTHVWQAIDRHIGAAHKRIFRSIQEAWMMNKKNWERFPRLKATERRTLFVNWVSQTRRKYLEKKDQHNRLMTAAGLRISLDGENNDKITVESNPLFQVQPFRLWDGLEEQVRKAILEDVEEQEDATSEGEDENLMASSSSSCSSGSSSSAKSNGSGSSSSSDSSSSDEEAPEATKAKGSGCVVEEAAEVEGPGKLHEEHGEADEELEQTSHGSSTEKAQLQNLFFANI